MILTGLFLVRVGGNPMFNFAKEWVCIGLEYKPEVEYSYDEICRI
jgi:hypothetical protein